MQRRLAAKHELTMAVIQGLIVIAFSLSCLYLTVQELCK
jgi:hypothetical protein